MIMKVLEKIIEYGIYLFIFLLPWQTRLILRERNLNGYWEYGTISIYATEILLGLIFLLTAVWWTINKLKSQNSKLETKSQISKLFHLTFSFFIVYSFLSIFWSDSRGVALQAWARLAEGVGLFLLLRVVKFDMQKLIWSFIFSALVQAGLGVWQFLTQSTFACKWLGMAFHDPIESGTFVVETALRRWLRAYGSLPHPNMLAGFLAVGLLLSVWLYQKIGYSFKKLLLPVIFSILTLGFLTTFSKSAMIAFILVMILLWIVLFLGRLWPSTGSGYKLFPERAQRVEEFGEKKITFLKFTLIFLAIAVIFGAVFWEPVSTRLVGRDRLEIKSTEQRLIYASQAWQLIKKRPFMGVGLGNYTLAVHNEIDPNIKSWGYQPVHNIYLLVLAELGIIGFIFFVSLFFCFSVLLFRQFKNFTPMIFLSIVFLIMMVGLFDHYFWTLYFGVMLFWFGLSLVQIRRET